MVLTEGRGLPEKQLLGDEIIVWLLVFTRVAQGDQERPAAPAAPAAAEICPLPASALTGRGIAQQVLSGDTVLSH